MNRRSRRITVLKYHNPILNLFPSWIPLNWSSIISGRAFNYHITDSNCVDFAYGPSGTSFEALFHRCPAYLISLPRTIANDLHLSLTNQQAHKAFFDAQDGWEGNT